MSSSADQLIRYTFSAHEYVLIQKHLLSRLPHLTGRTPPAYPSRVGSMDATMRRAIRMAIATWAAVATASRFRGKPAAGWRQHVRIAFTAPIILVLHRAIYGVLVRLRAALLAADAKGFRRRNPRVARALTARVAPAVGAGAMAGAALGVLPAGPGRRTVAVWAVERALEGGWDCLVAKGLVSWRPWWFGSWLLMPLSCGQLLHAFVFDRDCFPAAYGNFILKHSPTYIHSRSADYPSHLPWPEPHDVVDSLARMAELKYPPFTSPILFPDSKHPLPTSLSTISPITDPAHPAIKNLTCALLHPSDPSCARTYITHWIRAFPRLARVSAIVLTLFSLPRLRRALLRRRNNKNNNNDNNGTPWHILAQLVRSTLRTALSLTTAIGTTWGSICLFSALLPRHLLPRSRFFLSGLLAGLFFFPTRAHARSAFLYTARMSAESAWSVALRKRNTSVDVAVFSAALAAIGAAWDLDQRAAGSAAVAWWMRGLDDVRQAKGGEEDEPGKKKAQ